LLDIITIFEDETQALASFRDMFAPSSSPP